MRQGRIAGLAAGPAAIGRLHADFPRPHRCSKSRCFRLVVLGLLVPSLLAVVPVGPSLLAAVVAGPIHQYFEAALAGPIRLAVAAAPNLQYSAKSVPNHPVAAGPILQYFEAGPVDPIHLVAAGPNRRYSAILPNLALRPSLALPLSSS